MAVTSTWTPPASLDLATGAVLTEAIWDALISDLLFLGGTTGQQIARANLLVNGGFEVWQRGAGPITTGFTADRWFVNPNAGTASVTQNTANRDIGSRYALAIVTTGTTVVMFQDIKPGDGLEQLFGKTITYSMRIKTSTASAIRLRISPDDATYTYSEYHTGDGTFQTLSVTLAVPTNATNVKASVLFPVASTFYLDNAMLVVGGVAADYAPLHPADDLARCMRYFELFGGDTINGRLAAGQVLTTTVALYPITFRVEKAVVPTINFTTASNYVATNISGTGVAATVMGVDGAVSKRQAGIAVTVASGLVAGNGSVLMSANINGYISVEANP